MRKSANGNMRIGTKFYKGYSMKMRLTNNQLALVRLVANNQNIPVSTLLDMGFKQSMIDCLIKKEALWKTSKTDLLHISSLRLKGYKLIDPSLVQNLGLPESELESEVGKARHIDKK
jgi:hypothetical protein